MTPNDREQKVTALIDKLCLTHKLRRSEWVTLIRERTPAAAEHLFELARAVRIHHYGRDIYIRGLIEFTNYCRNDCYYCGIRRSNANALRYRLTKEDILTCCEEGYRLGFRTFVLQGGEDGWFTDERLCDIVSAIHAQFPGCAITLSVGERSYDSYKKLYDAGADRYLLRHETADPRHYRQLHPPEMSLENRMRCLRDLKELGYQTGTGMMIGSPGQTLETLWEDLEFIRRLRPEMIGIGPYLVHHGTPSADQKNGSLTWTLRLLSVLRLLYPDVLLPATTALSTLHPEGRKLGILAGANVVMPNLGMPGQREKYELYDHKLCAGQEAAEGRKELENMMGQIGYTLSESRGDFQDHSPRCRQEGECRLRPSPYRLIMY